jgi:hypothetical protein
MTEEISEEERRYSRLNGFVSVYGGIGGFLVFAGLTSLGLLNDTSFTCQVILFTGLMMLFSIRFLGIFLESAFEPEGWLSDSQERWAWLFVLMSAAGPFSTAGGYLVLGIQSGEAGSAFVFGTVAIMAVAGFFCWLGIHKIRAVTKGRGLEREKKFRGTPKWKLELATAAALKGLDLGQSWLEKWTAGFGHVSVVRIFPSLRMELSGSEHRSRARIRAGGPEMAALVRQLEAAVDREVESRLDHMQKDI